MPKNDCPRTLQFGYSGRTGSQESSEHVQFDIDVDIGWPARGHGLLDCVPRLCAQELLIEPNSTPSHKALSPKQGPNRT